VTSSTGVGEVEHARARHVVTKAATDESVRIVQSYRLRGALERASMRRRSMLGALR
jgi:hypothetical protein